MIIATNYFHIERGGWVGKQMKVIRFLFDRGDLAQENQEGEETSYARGRNPIALSRGGKDRNYFIQDEMGSTLLLLDQDHEIRKSYRYDAFGNILEEMGDIPKRLMYTGQMYDGVAVQYYLRARFYNPAIGLFMQEDTYRGDGLNLYAYCANNPVIYYDPSGYGLCPIGKMNPGATSEGESAAPTVDYNGEKRSVYRGGNDFTVGSNEVKINPETGDVKTSHGVSLDVNPETVLKFAGRIKLNLCQKD